MIRNVLSAIALALVASSAIACTGEASAAPTPTCAADIVAEQYRVLVQRKNHENARSTRTIARNGDTRMMARYVDAIAAERADMLAAFQVSYGTALRADSLTNCGK